MLLLVLCSLLDIREMAWSYVNCIFFAIGMGFPQELL